MKQNLSIYLVNAFIGAGFKGNQAAVCILDSWLPDKIMQAVALQIGLAETAFVVKTIANEEWAIRWFTPEIEMDLCGHATLAAAFVLFTELGQNLSALIFDSVSGKLKVIREQEKIILNFPSRNPERCVLPEIILKGIGGVPLETYKSRDFLLVFDNEEMIRQLSPNRTLLDQINLDPGGIIVTAKGNEADFVSRYFTPQASIFEDPVTGSAHCSLIPYWGKVLNKSAMIAHQLSDNKGILYCDCDIDRVRIGGFCNIYNKEVIHY